MCETVFKLEMVDRVPAASEDLRHLGYPCFKSHKPGKVKQNQYATWTSCARCALRLSYASKGENHGQERQAMPEPNLLRAAMEELERQIPAADCTEKLVNGKLMEIKGKMLQAGITQTMSIHMTFAEYEEKLRKVMPGVTPTPKAKVAPTPPSYQTEMPETPEDQTMDTLAAENAELRARLEAAEHAALHAGEAASQALLRTEALAAEAYQQKLESEKHQQEVKEIQKLAKEATSSTPAPPMPNGPATPEVAQPTEVVDSEDESEKRKRSKSQMKGQ